MPPRPERGRAIRTSSDAARRAHFLALQEHWAHVDAESTVDPMANYPSPTPGFSPGQDDDLGYIRTIDGHKPWAGGDEGANKHMPGEGFGGGGEQGLPVTEANDAD